MGILPELKDFPRSAIVGVATITACEEGNESLWAQRGPGAEYQWVMEDVHLFKEPILGVKGALGLFEVPGIDEDNLPPFAEIPEIERDGTHLRIPVSEQIFQEIETGETDALELMLTDSNTELFADWETLEPIPTELVTFFHGNREINKKLKSYETGGLTNDKGEMIFREDELGREYLLATVFMEF